MPNTTWNKQKLDCDLGQLNDIASNIASKLKVGDIIYLSGDLGAGKTTLAGMIIKSLIPDLKNVSSPTFNLAHVYNAKNFQIWHFDLYRIEKASDIYNLAIDDAFNFGISIIEWPEKAKDILPKDAIEIKINFIKNNPDKRTVHLNTQL